MRYSTGSPIQPDAPPPPSPATQAMRTEGGHRQR
jgi:hypothetical protein